MNLNSGASRGEAAGKCASGPCCGLAQAGIRLLEEALALAEAMRMHEAAQIRQLLVQARAM